MARPVGMAHDDASKKKISEGRTGSKHAPETKKKISEALKKAYQEGRRGPAKT